MSGLWKGTDSGIVRCLAQLSDGRVVSGSDDNTLKVWNNRLSVILFVINDYLLNPFTISVDEVPPIRPLNR